MRGAEFVYVACLVSLAVSTGRLGLVSQAPGVELLWWAGEGRGLLVVHL